MNGRSRGSISFWTCCAIVVLIANRLLAQSPIQLTDVTEQTGITFVHENGHSEQQYLVETVCSGLALFDYDNDGLIDIFFLSGASPADTPPSKQATNRLYRNLGNMRFEDVTEQAGVDHAGHGLGVAAADYDGDGDQDLYVNNYGQNVFYCNNGDGTFSAVENGTTPDEKKVGAGVAFLDIDGDGDLDLYVARYIQFDKNRISNRKMFGVLIAPGPKEFLPEADALYRNDGNGQFTDISKESGIAAVAGPGMGVIAFDFDSDGDTDIFVANDSAPNFLFENDGQGHFKEVAMRRSVATDYKGARQASMGVACGDYDNDGRLDLVVTAFQDEVPALYQNGDRGQNGQFNDRGPLSGLSVAVRCVTWGISFSDFDNDSLLDLYIATGHLIDTFGEVNDRGQKVNRDALKRVTRDLLLRNNGQRQFTDISAQSGTGLAIEAIGRAIGCDDLDNDGDIDVVILNLNAAPTILRNDLSTKKHWVDIQLIGNAINRDGIGAKVTCFFDNQKRFQEVHSGHGYQSHFGSRLHFGLGDARQLQRIEIKWHGGKTEVFENLAMDQLHILRQGSGK